MKTNLRMGCGLLMFLVGSIAYAGGVSDGGGGTTNPHPTAPEKIAMEVESNEASVNIVSWLNRKERSFHFLNADDQAKSPYRKLFGSGQGIFSVLKTAKFELRMKAPCRDANGAPKDGSIYGTEPGTLCLSPFSMGPKLNEFNFARETLALMIHELSHLVGTTEDEAVAIQWDAIRDFNRISFDDSRMKVLQQLTTFDDLTAGAKPIIQSPQNLRFDELDQWKENLFSLWSEIVDAPNQTLLFTRTESLKLLNPYFVAMLIEESFVCTTDPTVDSDRKKLCVEALEKSFVTDEMITARQVYLRANGTDLGPDYDLVKIKRPHDPSDVAAMIGEIVQYLSIPKNEVLALRDSQIATYWTD